MKQAIIYGGAFNPPTNAHQSILQACVDFAATSDADVWVMPSGNRIDKNIPVSTEHRLHMIKALISSINQRDVKVRVEDIELFSVNQTETYQTYLQLDRKHPKVQQIWVFGSDSIQTMKSWGDGEWLYNNLHMLIIERPGYELSELPPHAEILSINTQEVSSTLVRDHMSKKQDIAHLVPEHVHKTILNLGLFL